ncbi:MAG: DNA repair protein RecN [Elusimicrobiota bacterium]
MSAVLKELFIRSFAVVEEARILPGPGLNVFTGETGAGKSILIEALGFLLGERASVDWLRAGAKSLEVKGVFSGDMPEPIRKALGVAGELVLRRELDASGRSRAFVGDAPVSAALLSTACETLADFHGQHEHQSLLKPALQLELLDSFGGLLALRGRTAEAYRRWKSLNDEKESLTLNEAERERRMDLGRFQAAEIDQAAPRSGEEEELEAELPRLKHASRLMELSSRARELLCDGDGSVQESLGKAERLFAEMGRLDPPAGEALPGLARAIELVSEASSVLSRYQDVAESPDRLDELLSRQDKLARLKKKYGASIAEVLAFRERVGAELKSLENREGRLSEIDAETARARLALESLCSELHQGRAKAAAKLSARAGAEFKDLALGPARLSVCVEMEEESFSASGCDRVEFLIAPNPGEALKSLRATASGGEMSRVMLALKTVLSREDKVPLLVFDEVDAGVGGEAARSVGAKLAELAKTRQVLCVTHLPQVACFAQTHFEVRKEVSRGRTRAVVERLSGEPRLQALARMLGGRAATEASRRHARELLESVG